jgi:hypothetical protein
MNKIIKKIKIYFKPKNENWIFRVLKQRQKRIWIIGVSISIGIFLYGGFTSFFEVYTIQEKQKNILNRIDKYENKILNMKTLQKDQELKILNLDNLRIESKKPIAIINKVCELLKSKDVIGSFYIIKRKSKDYANVLELEIQISYGDKNLLFTVIELVLDKVFYIKNIEKTKLGVKCEIYKPAK